MLTAVVYVYGGTNTGIVDGSHAEFKTCVIKLIVPVVVVVAGLLIVNVVAFTIEVITVPAGIPVPYSVMPTARIAVLLPVTVVLPVIRAPTTWVVPVPRHCV